LTRKKKKNLRMPTESGIPNEDGDYSQPSPKQRQSQLFTSDLNRQREEKNGRNANGVRHFLGDGDRVSHLLNSDRVSCSGRDMSIKVLMCRDVKIEVRSTNLMTLTGVGRTK